MQIFKFFFLTFKQLKLIRILEIYYNSLIRWIYTLFSSENIPHQKGELQNYFNRLEICITPFSHCSLCSL